MSPRTTFARLSIRVRISRCFEASISDNNNPKTYSGRPLKKWKQPLVSLMVDGAPKPNPPRFGQGHKGRNLCSKPWPDFTTSLGMSWPDLKQEGFLLGSAAKKKEEVEDSARLRRTTLRTSYLLGLAFITLYIGTNPNGLWVSG